MKVRGFLITAGLLLLCAAPFIGPGNLVLPGSGGIDGFILYRIRLPRTILAFLCGAGLSLGGAAFQAMFRNPLATPYTLGVSSGSAFGAALVIALGIGRSLPGAVTVGALAGAGLAVLTVWTVARLRPDFSPIVLLLAGVALTFFFSSLILFIQYCSGLTDSFRIIHWLMGSFSDAGWKYVGGVLPFLVVGVLMLTRRVREMDLLSISSEIAAGRGVDVGRCRKEIFLGSSIIVAGVVAFCGPVGFVGMMAPHICRLLVGHRHAILVPFSMFAGGVFLVLCDTVARLILYPLELPVGILTAFLGGPFFLWLLVRRTRTA